MEFQIELGGNINLSRYSSCFIESAIKIFLLPRDEMVIQYQSQFEMPTHLAQRLSLYQQPHKTCEFDAVPNLELLRTDFSAAQR